MAGPEARVALQRTRFALIQDAADFNDENDSRPNRQLIATRLSMLELTWNKFHQEHESLYLSEAESLINHAYARERIYERGYAFYIYARSQLLSLQEECTPATPTTRSIDSVRGIPSTLTPRSFLPRIKLPSFSGDYDSWRSFHDLFSSLVRNNDDLSNVEKMHYLKTCVTDEAARLVGSLNISGDNFNIA